MRKKNKLKKWITILGIITAICGGLAPIVAMSIGGMIAYYLLITVGILFLITMILMMVSMVTAKDMVQKMAVFPTAFALVFTVLILRETGIDSVMKQMLGIIPPETEVGIKADGVFALMKYMHIGIMLSMAPIILTVVIKMIKVNKRNNVDFSTYDDAIGQIKNIQDTRTMINRQKVYKIEINVPYYLGQNMTVTKDFLVPMHMLHLLNVNVDLGLKINPNRTKEIYIVTEQGIL